MTVWGIITFGYDYIGHPVLEGIEAQEDIAKAMSLVPSCLNMDFPHRNMRGCIKIKVGKMIKVAWGDIHVDDEDKKKRIEGMIGGNHV